MTRLAPMRFQIDRPSSPERQRQMALAPTPEAVESLLTAEEDGPIVMLNLLKFKGEEGKKAYDEYFQLSIKHGPRFGAEFIYLGIPSITLIADEGQAWWDAVWLVRYPNRKQFHNILNDEQFGREALSLKQDVLEETVLQATVQWNPTGNLPTVLPGMGNGVLKP
jgi:hypothetical protein